MTKLNKIYTTEEYKAQGFTEEEIPLVIEHDLLHNKSVEFGLTDEEKDRMFELIEILKF